MFYFYVFTCGSETACMLPLFCCCPCPPARLVLDQLWISGTLVLLSACGPVPCRCASLVPWLLCDPWSAFSRSLSLGSLGYSAALQLPLESFVGMGSCRRPYCSSVSVDQSVYALSVGNRGTRQMRVSLGVGIRLPLPGPIRLMY